MNHDPFDIEETSIGFTGSREEPQPCQKKWLVNFILQDVLQNRITEAHHGCCEGSDEFFHKACKGAMRAKEYGSEVGLEQLVLHPPSDRKLEMGIDEWTMTNCVWYPRKPYLARNRDIVRNSSRLLALPNTMGPTRGSGTWYTINHAETLKVPIWICYPDGKVRLRHDGREVGLGQA